MKLTTALLACLLAGAAHVPSANSMDGARQDLREAAKLARERKAEATKVPTASANESVGWSYAITFMRHSFDTGNSYVYPTHYGMFASREECEVAKTERITKLEVDTRNITAPVMRPMREWTRESLDISAEGQTEETAKKDDKPEKSYGRRELQRQGGAVHVFRPEECVAHVYVDVSKEEKVSSTRPQQRERSN
jgi:hypothetical protein